MKSSVHNFSVNRLTGENLSLKMIDAKVLLIVNTASKCGFTPQYQQLEDLYKTYRQKGLEILGFPCNQFGKQEPAAAAEIGEFCERNYGVSFQMCEKIDVNGDNAHPLYRYLKSAAPGVFGTQAIKWNFTKFLVDKQGRCVKRYSPTTSPLAIAGDIEDLLA